MILAYSILSDWVSLLILGIVFMPFGFLLFRGFVFIFELFSKKPLARGFHTFMAGSGRLILLMWAFFQLFADVHEAISRIPFPDPAWAFWVIVPFRNLYALAMLILNFPKFPLKWNVRLFPVAQLFLLPPFLSIIFLISMGTDNKGGIFLIYLLFMLANAALWGFCLKDRAKAEEMNNSLP